MTVIQFMVVVIWAVLVLSMVVTTGVGGAIQASGLSKIESVPFLLVFLFVGVLAAITGVPLFLWIM